MKLSNCCGSIDNAGLGNATRSAAFALLLGAALPLAAQTTAQGKTIQTFLVYYGGGPRLVATDAQKLAKFDLLDVDRFRYNQLAPNTWSAVRALNPKIEIYLYEMGPESQNYMDANSLMLINGLGRHDVSRGHSMGSLNGNHPELFQVDAQGNRIYNVAYSNVGANQFWYLMDFGNPVFQTYWIEAVKADIADQPWAADGVHADNCLTFWAGGGYSAASSNYTSDPSWSNAMNSFVSAVTAGLHGNGQKLWCNRGATYLPAGAAVWRALDAGPNPPDVVAEEGAFAVAFGQGATQFFPEASWKIQVDILGAIKNSKVAMFSHTKLSAGQTGSDNFGNSVTFWQTLWYSLGSYLLGKNDTLGNAYFTFHGGDSNYNKIIWYDEYDKIDLGKASGSYGVTTIGGVNIYSREFERGYVLVNPTATNVVSVTLPQASWQLTHDNLLSPLSSVPIVSSISLDGHNAAILLKAPPDTAAPSTPAGLSASAVSSSQINLSWNASGDDRGVTGYYVYVNDVALATTAATSFEHTGLTAGTSYSYRVSARDAAGNNSVSTAPASATTLPEPAADAPSASRCFIATAAYGSPMARDVRYLRAFRDQYLLTNKLGRWLVVQYYRLSPPLADGLRSHDDWRTVVRFALSPLVALSKRVVSDETFEKQTVDRP